MKTLTQNLTDAFLQWHLPKSVCADGCTTTTEWPHPRYGTNLLTATETEQMIKEVILPRVLDKARVEAIAVKMRKFAAENYPTDANGQDDFVRVLLEGYAAELLSEKP